ncbi:MAG: putative lipid II flippase FtsW [Solirubrobacteraceae bacterium]
MSSTAGTATGAAPRRSARRPARPRASRPRPQASVEQRILLTATLCLLAFGIVMVYSASSASGVLEGGSGSSYLIKFALFGGVGLIVMRFLARDGIARLQGIVAPLLAVSLVLVLAVHVPGLGVSVNGAKRWIGREPFVFQPSELLKVALVLYSATVIARRPRQVLELRTLVKPLLLVVGAGVLLVASQPDIGTAMVIAFTIAAMLLAAGVPLRNLAIMGGAVVIGVLLFALVTRYARERLTSFLNPWAHPHSSGFQAVQGQIAVGSGGLFGVGPGRSVQKIFYLPEAPTDFILAVIGEELGVVGICALLSLYGLIAYAGLRVAKLAKSLHSALIAVGLTCMIVSGALLNVFSVLGLAPLTGVPLPFVSYGSSDLIVALASIGLLMNIAAGGTAHVRAVAAPRGRPRTAAARATGERRRRAASDASGREQAGFWDERAAQEQDRDRGGGHGGTRRAGARGRG